MEKRTILLLSPVASSRPTFFSRDKLWRVKVHSVRYQGHSRTNLFTVYFILFCCALSWSDYRSWFLCLSFPCFSNFLSQTFLYTLESVKDHSSLISVSLQYTGLLSVVGMSPPTHTSWHTGILLPALCIYNWHLSPLLGRKGLIFLPLSLLPTHFPAPSSQLQMNLSPFSFCDL